MRYDDDPAIRMLAHKLVGPCKGFVPGLELQREDEELHSTCFQKEVVILDFSFLTKMATLFFAEMGMIQWVFRETRWRKIGAKMAGAGVARLSVYGGITHVMVSRAQHVGDMIVDRLESAIGDLPLVLVFSLGDVSHMDCHGDGPADHAATHGCGHRNRPGHTFGRQAVLIEISHHACP